MRGDRRGAPECGRRQAQLGDGALHALGGRHVRDDERAGRELHALGRERLLGHAHRHVLQPVAQRDHVVGAEVRDGECGGAAARRGAGEPDLRDRRDRRVENARVVHLHDVHAEGVADAPAAVV
ncbi:hypothetical protein RZS08_20330, partial [Arthrospira platensis SPKY1]|nr:hypothetical protein [Arthrospira platensis SPKY1]